MKTLRARLTALSVASAAVGLTLGAYALARIGEHVLLQELHRDVAAAARGVAAAVDDRQAATAVTLVPTSWIAQVRSNDGNVIAASTHRVLQSDDRGRLEVLTRPATDDSEAWVTGTSDLGALGPSWQTASAHSGDGTATVTIAAPTADLRRSAGSFARIAATAVPVLVAMTGFLVWAVLGRALAPIDVARRRAEEAIGIYPPPALRTPGAAAEIDSLVATLDDLLQRNADAARTQRRFLADAAHELLSPLAVLRTNIEIAIRRGPTPDVRTGLERCAQTQERLEALAQQLLALAHAESPSPAELTQLDLVRLVNDVIDDLGPHTRTAVSTSSPERLEMTGDPTALRQLVDNLLRNACRHARSSVTVTLQSELDVVRLHVDDDGAGIPERDRVSVLQPFVRLDAGRDRASGGAGLGLSIVDAIAARHGGTVSISESPAAGARVSVTLPRHGLALPDAAAGPPPTGTPCPPNPVLPSRCSTD